jgi:hypothetical protein
MKLSSTLAILFSSSLLALTACGTSVIGGGGDGGSGGGTTSSGGSAGGLCNGVPSALSCTDTSCPDGYTCVTDPDPTTCHSSSCTCEAQGWACTDDCAQNGRSCVKLPADCSMFPSFDKSCSTDSDCVAKLHQVNCCGTRVSIGINVSQSAAFDVTEAACAAQFPACGCAEQATTGEDGKTMPDYSDSFPVACKAGQCTTYGAGAVLCNGQPPPVGCNDQSCPDGYTCVPDTGTPPCHSSGCVCGPQGWMCTPDCSGASGTCGLVP